MGSHFSKATVSKIDETSFNYDEIFLTKKAKKDIDDEKLLFDDLMLNRADLNVKGSEGTKLLHAACRRGFLDVVHFFVDLGADVNSRGNDKSTILHEAVVGNNFELIDFLLFNGLDINAKDKRGETPLHRLVVPSQKNYNNFETDKIRENKFKEYVDMVEFLVDNGADVNAQDGNFVTPLEKAVYMNFVEICECLLELKASIEFRKDVILFSFYVPNEKIKKDDTEIESLRLLTAFLATRKDDISQYIDAISKQDFGNFHWVEFLFHECKLEVEQMKKINICEERNVSHFDFLTKDLMEVTNFSRSGDLMTVLESREFKEKFSCYKYLLEKRIGRIKKLQNCINAITKFLKKYAKLNLPIVVLDKIFSFLSAGDVRNFGRALSIKRKNKLSKSMDPFINTNKVIMCTLGQWPYQSIIVKRIIRMCATFAAISLEIPIWIKVYECRNDFDDLLLALPMALTAFNTIGTFIFFVIKEPQILLLLECMAKDFEEFKSHEAELKILQKSAAEGHYAVKVFAIYTGMSTIGYCLEGLFVPKILDIISPLNETRNKVQLAELDYVIFEADDNFFFTFTHISLTGIYLIGTMVTAELMFYTFCQHGCGLFRILRYRLSVMKNIKNISNLDEIHLEGVACVKLYNKVLQSFPRITNYHCRKVVHFCALDGAKRFIDLINSCYTNYLLFLIGSDIILMSFQGAMIVIKMRTDINIVISYGTYYLALLILLLYGSIPGQMLLDHSRELTNHLYCTEWYVMTPRVKKLLLLIMTRSLRESKVTIGHTFTMCIETFSSILRTIFSYLSVLTSMKE